MRSNASIAAAVTLLALGACDTEWAGPVVVAVEPTAADAGPDAGLPTPDAGVAADAGTADAGSTAPVNLALVALSALPAALVPGTSARVRARVASTGLDGAPASELVIELVPERADTPTVRIGGAQLPTIAVGAETDLAVELWVPSGALEQRSRCAGRWTPTI